MLLQAIKESIKLSLRSKEVMIWTMIFPILLSLLFYVSFGSLDQADQLEAVPVAVLEEEMDEAEGLWETLQTISNGEEPLLTITVCGTEEEALKLLEEGQVDGVIRQKMADTLQEPVLVVKEEGINQTILRQVMNQYQQTSQAIQEAMLQAQQSGDPAALEQVMKALESTLSEAEESMVERVSLTRSTPSASLGFFYSLLGMVCLFGTFHGNNAVILLQANQSALGARRCISPRNYGIEMVGAIAGGLLVHMISVWVALLFQAFVLKIDFGGRLWLAALGCGVGSMAGVAIGAFMGSFPKLSANAKTGLSVTISLLLSFLSGLMVGGVNYWVHQNIPILSWINPAARLVDALQSLYYFDSLSTFWLSTAVIFVISIVIFLLSALRLRRYQYESI